MPVYEYECKECERVFEVQQKMTDEPLQNCPECRAPVKKLVSMSSFQLKGGGWYADGYASNGSANASKATPKPKTEKSAPACAGGEACKGCAAAA